jgi:photosystem II stability/assembly factor-like uncharacterized protein
VPAASGAATLLRTGSGVVWASVDDDIFRSTDGGAHWSQVLPAAAHPATCGCFYHSYFFGPERAWDVESLSVGSSFGARLWSTIDGGRSWQVGTLLPVPPLWQPIQPDLQGVGYTLDFTSPSNGYLDVSTTVQPGAPELLTGLWHTRDGGRSWTEVGGTHVPLNGLEVSASSVCGVGYLAVTFANPERGWIANPCGKGPPMWETHDGGATWRPIRLATPPGGWGRGVAPMPAQPALTSSGAVIDQVTTGVGALVVEEINADGSWRYLGRLRTGGIGLPATLDVIDATHFVLPASDGIWVSDDAAKTWHFVSSGIDLAGLGSMSLFLNGSQQITGIVLAESDSGTGSDPTAVALRTTDGGRSWQSVGSALAVDPYVGEPRYDLLTFPSPRVGYLAGEGGLSVTHDDGRTWHSALGMSEPIQQLDVEGTNDAVVLSSDSLLTTSDGGSHWRVASEPAAGALYSVSFVGAGVGYGVVCESNDPSLQNNVVALVRTTDDGKSWRAVPVPPGFACTAISNGEGTPPSELCVASPEVLYAIAGPLVERPRMMLPQPTILFRSLDGGRSWSRVAGISDAGIVSCDGDTLWTVVEQSFRSDSAYAVRYSSDGGRHFRSLIGATSGPSTYADIGLQGVQMKHAAGMFGSIATPTTSSAVPFVWTNAHTRTILQATSDTGRSWAPPRAVPVGDLAGPAFFLSTRSGFILNQSDSASSITSLLATNDSGRRWQTVAQFPPLP